MSSASIDDMKSYIQEWMARSISAVELAQTYAECMHELNQQLEYCMESFTEEATHE